MSDWNVRFVEALKAESVDDELLVYLDDILSWVSLGKSNAEYVLLCEEIGEECLTQRVEEFLDRLLMGGRQLSDVFLLSINTEHAKKRYRQLIRVFHPDRGVKPEAWLNNRAEKINKAYNSFLNREEGEVEPSFSSEAPSESGAVDDLNVQSRKIALKTKFRYKPNVWRDRLGSPKEFQKKILLTLLVFPAFLVLLVYWSNRDLRSEIPASTTKDEVKKNQTYLNSTELQVQDFIAKKILQEADEFIKNNDELNILEFEDIDRVAKPMLSLHEYDEPTQLVESGDGHDEADLLFQEEQSKQGDGCHSYIDLPSLLLDGRKDEMKRLESKVNLLSGPSIECNVLIELESDSKIFLDSVTKDGLWAKVLVENEKQQSGWVDMTELGSSVEGYSNAVPPQNSRHLVLDAKPVIKEMPVPVARVPISNIGEEIAQVNESTMSEIVKLSADKGQNFELIKPKPKPNYLSLVEQLKLYYELGDSSKMSGLYIGSGRENEIRGAEKVRKYYRKAFARTVNRKFDYMIESYRSIEESSTALVKGRMNLSMESKKSGEVNEIDAQFAIWLIRLGKSYKIVSFEWARR